MAAALNYFDKSLNDLSVAEAAFLAAYRKHLITITLFVSQMARARRNYVLSRMVEDGFITAAAAAVEMSKKVRVRPPGEPDAVRADYFVEEVMELKGNYGDSGLYGGGLQSVQHSILLAKNR